MVEIKPCRVCEVPPENYPPSRIVRNDWICTTCSNKLRAKWWAQLRIKKRELETPVKLKDMTKTIQVQLALFPQVESPNCVFCNDKMRPTRGAGNKGDPVRWECHPCNQIIRARGI